MLLSRPDTGSPTLPFLRAGHIPQAPLYMSCGHSYAASPGSSLRAHRGHEWGLGCPAFSETLGDAPPLPRPRAGCPSEEPMNLEWSRALTQVPGLLASPAGVCPRLLGTLGLRARGWWPTPLPLSPLNSCPALCLEKSSLLSSTQIPDGLSAPPRINAHPSSVCPSIHPSSSIY